MDKRALNTRLNGLKDAYPSDLALIEGIQDILNRKVEVISSANAHALVYSPVQFIDPIPTSHGEWTTQMHIWADNLAEPLLQVDPRFLTAKDSLGYSVLHEMVQAATGKFTQMVNYDYIQRMLDKNMSFIYMEMPNDPATKIEGNAWMEADPYGKTPMDYLIDAANGDDTGIPDEQLSALLDEFSQTPAEEPPVDSTPDTPMDNAIPGQEDGPEMAADPAIQDGQSDADTQQDDPEAGQPGEVLDSDRTTYMENPDPDNGDPGTPTQEKAMDNQQSQIDQAKEELKQQPNPMLESLFRLC